MKKRRPHGLLAAIVGVTIMTTQAFAQNKPSDADNFYQSTKVTVEKVTFPNQYRMKIAG